MLSSSDYLFVYGTLRSGFMNPYARLLHDNGNYVSRGTFRGRLYDLGSYPGAIADLLCLTSVQGEVFNIGTHKNRLLTILDAYEGIVAGLEATSEYVRTELIVRVDGQEIICWTYLYNWPLRNERLIESGDFLLR